MAVTISPYNQFIALLGNEATPVLLGPTGDDIRGALLNASHSFVATNTGWAQISANEIAGVNGYTTNGQLLTGVAYAQTGGIVTFSSNNLSWLAAGGSIVARNCVLYNDTAVSPADALLIDINFGTSDETAGDGTNFIVAPDGVNGWYTGSITGASA